MRLQWNWRPYGAWWLILLGFPMVIPLGTSLAGFVYAAIIPAVEPDERAFGLCLFGLLSYWSFLAVAMAVTGLARGSFPPRVTIDPIAGRCEIRHLPWRCHSLALNEILGVEVLSGWLALTDFYWVAVRVAGRRRPVSIRQYASNITPEAEGVAVQAAELLATALGVSVSRRELSIWEKLSTW